MKKLLLPMLAVFGGLIIGEARSVSLIHKSEMMSDCEIQKVQTVSTSNIKTDLLGLEGIAAGDGKVLSNYKELVKNKLQTLKIIEKLDLTQVGRGVNLAKGNPLAYKEKEPIQFDIFNREWLDNVYENGTATSSKAYTHVVSEMSNSTDEIVEKIKTDSNLNANFSASYACYKAAAETNLGLSTNNALSASTNKILYSYIYTRSSYIYTLPDIYNEHDDFINNLNSSYLNKLQRALNSGSLLDYANLFDTYGTHILVSANFGGAYDVFYSATSKSIDFENELSFNIKQKLEGAANYNGVQMEGGTESGFNMESELKSHTFSLDEHTECLFYGGSANGTTGTTSFNGIVERAAEWAKTIDNQPCIVKYANLLPIWEMLPEKYENRKNEIALAFQEYSKKQDALYDAEQNILGDLKASKQLVQQKSEVTCGDYWDVKKSYTTTVFNLMRDDCLYDFDEAKRQGFKKMKIKLFFTAIRDGRSGSKLEGAFVTIGNSETVRVASNIPANAGEIKDCYTISKSLEDISRLGGNVKVEFWSNNRGAAILHWKERECVLGDIYFQITYTR